MRKEAGKTKSKKIIDGLMRWRNKKQATELMDENYGEAYSSTPTCVVPNDYDDRLSKRYKYIFFFVVEF